MESSAALTMGKYVFKNINTLSCITLQNKDGDDIFHAFLLKNGIVRMIKVNEPTFDIALKSEIIAINSGNTANSLFIVDAIRVIGLLDKLKIKNISCGYQFTMFLEWD